MASQEDLDILKQGAKIWNQWRLQHPERYPNLSGADLSYADLSGTDLSGADLSRALLGGANLKGADLSGANLYVADLEVANLSNAKLNGAKLQGAELIDAKLNGANLARANLSDASLVIAHFNYADLSGAFLRGANFRGAYLSYADLSGADLIGADLSGVNLSGANLSGAYLGGTAFSNVDLRSVKGLETVQHRLPSSIGIDTIYHSQGDIPEAFLKGAGVNDAFITYIRSLIGKPIEYYSCFISYSSIDEPFASRLYADLQSNNVRSWFAPEDMKTGDEIRSRIDEAIRIHDKLLLVLSKHSVNSTWVKKEVEAAYEKEDWQKRLVLFPIRLDDTVMHTSQAWAADIRRTRHVTDFTCWKDHEAYQRAFDRLLRDLKAGAQKMGPRDASGSVGK